MEYMIIVSSVDGEVSFVIKGKRFDFQEIRRSKMSSLDYGSERWICPVCNKVQDIKTVRDGDSPFEYVVQSCSCDNVFDDSIWTYADVIDD